MKNSKNNPFREKVFSMARHLQRISGKSWPVCLSRAWQLHRFVSRLHREIVTFAYEKSDGTLRKANGTLREMESLIKGTGRECHKTIRYYDIDAKEFRSFRIENLISVY